MWAVRLSLLAFLGRYGEAMEEMKTFGELDQPDLYYQYNRHNYPNHTGERRKDGEGVSWYITLPLLGSMVPFSMRVLHAELPMHCNNHQLSLNRFCLLQHTCQHVLDSLLAGSLPISNHKLTDQQKNGRYASGSGQGACPLVAKKKYNYTIPHTACFACMLNHG